MRNSTKEPNETEVFYIKRRTNRPNRHGAEAFEKEQTIEESEARLIAAGMACRCSMNNICNCGYTNYE